MLNNKQIRRIKQFKKQLLPAILPDDYEGSVADWHYALYEAGLWDGDDPSEIMDIKLSAKNYSWLLEICEKP